jgi:peptidoglycan/LPS O-acetylase OafA/YrhL
MQYRAEIDGLRALAVLPVILFHAGFEWISGGFIGVDVFFVISGYLITTIIISEISEGRFSILNFYERRARRILPALFFVMAVCLPLAWLWLQPYDLKYFGRSLLGISTFSSNILFWIESGYFDTAAELKPLLHTWSLSVEEQYYILFPIFLMLAWRLGIEKVIVILAMIFFVSLAVAEWSTQYSASPTVIAGAFFLLPTRAWELLIGVFVAFYLKYRVPRRSPVQEQVLSLLGLGMVIYSFFVFDENTPFPSSLTLLPTLGTALIILFAVPKTLVYSALSLKPMVGLGLISYSAYLWHQPILAFAKHQAPDAVPDWALIFLCCLAVSVAWVSWRFIEKPFRDKKAFPSRFVFQFSGIGLVMFFSIGLIALLNEGFTYRLSVEEKGIYQYRSYDIESSYREGTCFLRPEQRFEDFADECFIGSKLIWGDSHAAALSYGLRIVGDFAQLSASACPPIINQPSDGRPHCAAINEKVLSAIKSGAFEEVIIHGNWIGYTKAHIDSLVETVDELLAARSVARIKIIGGVPRWNPSLPDVLLRRG